MRLASHLLTTTPWCSLQVEQQEQRLAQRKEEHQTAVSRAEGLREEEQRLHHRVKVTRGRRRMEQISSDDLNSTRNFSVSEEQEVTEHRGGGTAFTLGGI